MASLRIDPSRQRYRALIGTGGIGAGDFFALSGDHTLGREESRAGRFLDRNDYCKLHIITHYVQALMGEGFTTLPIGKVGGDETGRRLAEEMAAAGLDLRHVHVEEGEQTLYSFCFIYPDGNGGNLTVDDSASAKVTPALVAGAEGDFALFAGAGIALAVPEVPFDARVALLEMGARHGFLRAASFTSEEMTRVRAENALENVDLLAVNFEEAAAAAGVSAEGQPADVVEAAVEVLGTVQPSMHMSVTAGTHGSWVRDGGGLLHTPAVRVEAESTAGAGDAHLSGILSGLAAGLPLHEAHELGVLTAALAVTSLHTINKAIDRESLRAFADAVRAPLCARVRELLED
ncbi:MAG: PfkB family carbohydrate kinase [Candidatus Brocadiia bacterium]|jgi:ribokinase|nr:PfkB family carbohydrate kinase [Candidatus Brocadiia bacterium]